MFSRTTILEIVKALNLKTHDEVERFSFAFSLDDVVSGRWIKEKETSIAKYIISNPEAKGPNGSALPIEIIEYIAKNHHGFDPLPESYTELAHSLDRDGFELTENGIRRQLPQTLPLVEQEDQLIALLLKHSFNDAKGHYSQAVAAHARGEWASANAQLRTFVESFIDKAHTIVCGETNDSANQKRIALAKAGFFINEYNEFLFNGTGFIEGFWKRLHPQGSHPGLSEQSDSTFRLHLVIIVVHYLMKRIDEHYSTQIIEDVPR